MAIYHLSADIVRRSDGRTVTAAAAYRAGERIIDQRTGLIFDYRARSGVMQTAIIAPLDAPAWMCDRATLWNGIEATEKRKDAQLARDIEMALPHELTPGQRLDLVRSFVEPAFVSQGMVADIAIHAPCRRDADRRNHHAHILLTMRVIDGDSFGPKVRAWNDTAQLEAWRASWAEHVNRALATARQNARVDHRSLAAQGIRRVPQIHLGPAVVELAARGIETDRSDVAREIEAMNLRASISRASRSIEVSAPSMAFVPSSWPSLPDPPEDPIYAPEREDSIDVLSAPAMSTPEPEPQTFVGKNSYAIDDTPIVTSRARGDENPDDSPGMTGEIVSEPEPCSPPRTLGGAIKTLFRSAVKALLRRVEAAPQPKRSRKGETAGEFRRLARHCSRRYDVRADFKGRTAILSRSFSIPTEVYSMAAAHLSELINDMNNDSSDLDDNFNTIREYISLQP